MPFAATATGLAALATDLPMDLPAARRWRVPVLYGGAAGEDLETTLVAIARLRIADLSTPEGVRLRRIITTESYRFPDLLMLSYSQGAQPVHDHLADLLRRHDSAGAICVDRPDMAASLFMTMVLGGPIRLVGSPQPMSAAEVDDWVRAAVRLFLNGIRTRSD